MTYIKNTKNKNRNFSEKILPQSLSRHVFHLNISKSDAESLNLAFFKAMPSFLFKRYGSFHETHCSRITRNPILLPRTFFTFPHS
jgi:hypothetical protein